MLITDCILIANDLNEYRYYTKILLVPVLLIGIYNASKDTKHRRSKTIANIAFLFCFLGDLFLLDDKDTSFFMLGLSSFLIAHICFIIFFFRLKPFSNKYRLSLFTSAFIIFSYVTFLLFFIWTGISRQMFQIPVTLYAIILGCMLLTAIHASNNKSVKRLTSSYFIPGAVLFVLSDSILAINKFAVPFTYGGIFVMATYAGAVFMLATGITRFLKK